MRYSEPFYTKDLDLWIEPARSNAEAVMAALRAFGAPVSSISIEDLMNPELVYQVGVEPVRVDIVMAIPGVSFEDAWRRRLDVDLDGVTAHFIAFDDLVRSKEMTGRKSDKEHVRRLRRALKNT
jgi:predicted nucleotidyltransferase